MSRNLEKKKELVARLSQDLQKAASVILTDFRGLTVEKDVLLRRKAREQKVHYKVVKNTLLKRAAEEAGIHGLDPYLEGPTAIAYSFEDPVATARVIHEFAEEEKVLTIKAGVVEGRLITADAVEGLAKLPPRPVLLAQLAGAFQAPLQQVAGMLAAPLRSFLYGLKALEEKKAQAG
ncbi:MAG: 50S ribosomal protein L10 [Clostridiales bacterium]|nr:50S ribosomal protein L10 [Clostridiales bacterium]